MGQLEKYYQKEKREKWENPKLKMKTKAGNGSFHVNPENRNKNIPIEKDKY